jgi:hypothetical protein
MADKKISALTAATTPLAGTEVLPIVQGGTTNKVSVADLTAGRDVSMAGATSTDHYKVAAGKGLAWSGNTASYITPEDNVQGARIAAGGSFKLLVGGGNEAIDVNFSTQNITATAGNLVIGTAGKGIDFSANGGAPGMTSELLTWYEEGTWTPTMTSASGTTTVNSSSARYTRIGDKVFVVFQINYSTDASVSTSDFTIGGLPFTSRGTFNSRGFVTSSNWTGSDYNDGYLTVNAATTTITWAGRAVNQNSRTNAVLLFCADYFAT